MLACACLYVGISQAAQSTANISSVSLVIIGFVLLVWTIQSSADPCGQSIWTGRYQTDTWSDSTQSDTWGDSPAPPHFPDPLWHNAASLSSGAAGTNNQTKPRRRRGRTSASYRATAFVQHEWQNGTRVRVYYAQVGGGDKFSVHFEGGEYLSDNDWKVMVDNAAQSER